MRSLSAITRRDLFKATGSTMIGTWLNRSLPPAPEPPAQIHFGLQTNAYPISPINFSTCLAAIDQAASAGFEGFETGYRNVASQFVAPDQARASIASTGLTFFGIHIFLQSKDYDPETHIAPRPLLEQVARGGHALGAQNVIASGAPAETADQLKTKIDGLNAAALLCRDIGIGFSYHNEEPESGSKLHELDALYSDTDPKTVSFLLDVGHLFNVGGDVVAFLRRHHQRICGLHLRDYKNGQQVVLGTGDLPLTEIAQTLKRVRWSGWVENEEERLDGVKHGNEYLVPALAAARKAFQP